MTAMVTVRKQLLVLPRELQFAEAARNPPPARQLAGLHALLGDIEDAVNVL